MDALLLLMPPVLAGLIASFLFEPFLEPKPSPIRQRSLSSLLIHIGTWLLLFAVMLLLFRRPWFAVVIIGAIQLLLLLVHQAKYFSLREAFIFQDFEYFTDAIKHPRLYLPFFGVARTIAATIGFIGALIVGMLMETPLTETIALPLLASLWFVMLACGLLLIRLGLKNCPPISCDPGKDLYSMGQIPFYWAYWQEEKRVREIDLSGSPFQNPPEPADDTKRPHIVVVQSESFFDPRPLSNNIKPTVLTHFDRIKTESDYHGRLQVPAWGANTVRTECAFLSGLPPDQLGIHRFNPYRLLAGQGIPTLASHLKQRGYRTVCIHPYPAGFYLRDRVFPRLGFDQFIDINSFDAQQKSGQYIGDLAVADKINELLAAQDANQPVFIFVITMENHGPLHLEQSNPDDHAVFYHQAPHAGCEDLTVYLRHLNNADLMIERLKEGLLHSRLGHDNETTPEKAREGILCWYGDHVPIMATVYAQLGEPDGDTDYFIWKTARPDANSEAGDKTVCAHELAALMLGIVNTLE